MMATFGSGIGPQCATLRTFSGDPLDDLIWPVADCPLLASASQLADIRTHNSSVRYWPKRLCHGGLILERLF